MSRKICVVTGSRAEYGLLRWVMEGISLSPKLQLQLIATGMHLSPEFGLTYQEIEKDGFHIDRKVEMILSSDTPSGVTKSIGLGMIGFGEVLDQLRPDLLVVLGDRFEILSAVIAAMMARIPVAHLHGGEITEGAIDDSIRHSITKMSHFHFVATEEYRKRVIQLGEQPDNVHVVGGLGIDSIKKLKLLDLSELEDSFGFKFGPRNLLITFHPVTLEKSSSSLSMAELLAALDELVDTNLYFTMPNADTDGRIIMDMIEEFVTTHNNAHSFISLGTLRYLSCLQQMDGLVGNSSSGLIEAPSFGKGAINIGDRQLGRLKAESVIDCKQDKSSISAALVELYSTEFQDKLKTVRNPYGDGGASELIVDILTKVTLENIIKKKFYDLP